MAAATRSFTAKHKDIYASARDCQRYDCELCQRQDYRGALLAAIRDVIPISCHTRAADVGAGTGKFARMLSPHVGSVVVTDRSAEAISVARNLLGDRGLTGCTHSFHVADVRALPLESDSIDLVVAGWAVSYLKSEHEVWYADGSSGGPWREEVNAALAEFDRVLAPGGTLIIFETMGTATEASQRSGSWLYRHFRDEGGFSERSIRTDYRFPSKHGALETLRFFFGKGVATRAEKLLAAVPAEGEECVVPEVTGMWWRRKEGATAQVSHGYRGNRVALNMRGLSWWTRTWKLVAVEDPDGGRRGTSVSAPVILAAALVSTAVVGAIVLGRRVGRSKLP